MKKYIFLTAALLVMGFVAHAQNYMVVKSEEIFKSIDSYNSALTQLDNLGEQYQRTIDNAFDELERTYNTYQNQKANLSATVRAQREQQIVDREKAILQQQERYFGEEGELIKKRIELIKPIQDRVFNAINSYAQSNGFQMVIDASANVTLLYYSPAVDKTQDIIRTLR